MPVTRMFSACCSLFYCLGRKPQKIRTCQVQKFSHLFSPKTDELIYLMNKRFSCIEEHWLDFRMWRVSHSIHFSVLRLSVQLKREKKGHWWRLAVTLVATGPCVWRQGGRVTRGKWLMGMCQPSSYSECWGGKKGGSLIGARCKSLCHSSSSSLICLEAKASWSMQLND